MDADQPRWVDKEFLELALTNGGKDENVTIKKFTIKPAVESGDNYCTQLYRVKVDYQRGNANHSKSLIIKAPLDESAKMKPLIEEIGLVEIEYAMYNNILPKIYAISNQEFGPKTYFCKRDDVLVMDDLVDQGFIMKDRFQQLDLDHSKMFFVVLAKYHATTVALHNQDPQLVESNGIHPIYNDTKVNQLVISQETFKRMAFETILQKINGMEKLVDTIQTYRDNIRPAVIKLFQDGGSVNVLNHGDCWTNNIMFKYTEGELSDCKLIDFQIRSYGTPAVDLLYFLLTSAKTEVRRHHMKELLQLYCDTLNKTLSDYSCKERLSKEVLWEEIKNATPWALTLVINFLPMILKDEDKISDELIKSEENMKSLDINTNPTMRMLLGKSYNAILPEVCTDLLNLGLADYFKNLNS